MGNTVGIVPSGLSPIGTVVVVVLNLTNFSIVR